MPQHVEFVGNWEVDDVERRGVELNQVFYAFLSAARWATIFVRRWEKYACFDIIILYFVLFRLRW